MKHLLLTTIAAVVLVGCGNPEADRALIDATEAGDIESIKQHLAAGADVNATDEVGWTPLHHAIIFNEKNQMKIVELLIDKGADVNATDEVGRTVRLPPFSDHGSAFLRWNLPCPSSVL